MFRIATIGTSTITRRLADAVAAVDGVEISCIYSRDAARAEDFARALGVTRWESDLATMLASTTVDAIYVASPNSVHHDQALAAIRAGKHVLVEKAGRPHRRRMGRTRPRSDSGRRRRPGSHPHRVRPRLDAIRDALRRLRPIRRVSLRYEKRSARYDLDLAGQRVNMFDPAMAGGALMDLRVYCTH